MTVILVKKINFQELYTYFYLQKWYKNLQQTARYNIIDNFTQIGSVVFSVDTVAQW